MKKQNNANKAGKGVEEALAAFMRVLRWDFDQHVKAGPSIYKGQIQVVDFVIRNLKDFLPGLIVESRWQSKHGTVDQKFPYLQKSLETCAMPSIVIVSGGGCRSGALAWLKEQCDDHLLDVFSLDEFFKWALRREIRDPIYDTAKHSDHSVNI